MSITGYMDAALPEPGPIIVKRLQETRMHERVAAANRKREAELRARFEALNGPEPSTWQAERRARRRTTVRAA